MSTWKNHSWTYSIKIKIKMNTEYLVPLLNTYKSFCNLILLYVDMCAILNILNLLHKKKSFLWL